MTNNDKTVQDIVNAYQHPMSNGQSDRLLAQAVLLVSGIHSAQDGKTPDENKKAIADALAYAIKTAEKIRDDSDYRDGYFAPEQFHDMKSVFSPNTVAVFTAYLRGAQEKVLSSQGVEPRVGSIVLAGRTAAVDAYADIMSAAVREMGGSEPSADTASIRDNRDNNMRR